MKFSALTKALLNDEASVIEKSSPKMDDVQEVVVESARHTRAGSASLVDSARRDRTSPSRIHSPFPRRVVRLSGTPRTSSLRRTASMSSAVKARGEEAAPTESLLDLNTPVPAPRTVRLPYASSGRHGLSGGSSGRLSARANSAPRVEEAETNPDAPRTAARSHLALSQGSVSRFGTSTIGRSKYGEEIGLQSSIRPKGFGKVAGKYLSGPARRGRKRQEDEDQSPMEKQENAFEMAVSSQEPQSQESQNPDPQSQEQGSSQGSERYRPSIFSSQYRDFAAASPVSSNVEHVNSVMRSKSPPPPSLSLQKRPSTVVPELKPFQPVFKLPAPPVDLPSAHDQENEAPPTFKRNKQAPLIHLDKMEKVPVRPASIDMSAQSSPERRPLAPRSHNTPRRPAPPPPKMSVLEAATSNAGAAATSHANAKRNKLKVNGKAFTRLDIIGRGGSSKVYRVMAENSKIFALKRVSLDDADEMAVLGFKGEIDLLKKLSNCERVIHLYDYEMNEEKGILSVVSVLLEMEVVANDISLWRWASLISTQYLTSV